MPGSIPRMVRVCCNGMSCVCEWGGCVEIVLIFYASGGSRGEGRFRNAAFSLESGGGS